MSGKNEWPLWSRESWLEWAGWFGDQARMSIFCGHADDAYKLTRCAAHRAILGARMASAQPNVDGQPEQLGKRKGDTNYDSDDQLPAFLQAKNLKTLYF